MRIPLIMREQKEVYSQLHDLAMCKSSTLAFVLLFAFAFRLEKPSLKLVSIILTIVSGVILMVSDETEFEFTG